MQRDWGLFAIGVGVLVLSAAMAVPELLVYGESSGCDPHPMDDVAGFGGRRAIRTGLIAGSASRGTVAFLAASLVLLLVAFAVMHRGLTRPRQH